MIKDDFICDVAKSRRGARQLALQVLYAVELSGNDPSVAVKALIPDCTADPKLYDFILKLVEMTWDYREEFDAYIQKFSANWKFERIAILDLIIMRMALCEFLHFFDIPPKVSIDEAIELAKIFSTYKSGGFINGILDAVLLDLKDTKQLVKTGRGKQTDRNNANN